MAEYATAARLLLEFTAYWCAGSGGGRGRHLDAVCHRDKIGLPAMYMTEIKGTLRETAEQLAENGIGGWDAGKVNRLFGPRTEDGGTDDPAALDFGDEARMLPTQASAIGNDQEKALLFVRVPATKVDEKTGIAADKTLRFVECAVPLTLEGVIQWQADAPPDFDWISLLDVAAAATTTFGKAKNDGMGRAIATLTPDNTIPDPATPVLTSEVKKAHRVGVVLHQARPAIFSKRAATEASHATLDAPTGAALLGWCAAQGPYEKFSDPWKVFHSGSVRFGNAVPLDNKGRATIAMPRNLFLPKGVPFCRERVSVGVPKNTGGIQYESCKGSFLTADMDSFEPKHGQRLRTATSGGRAARGKLFGYQHLEAHDGPSFVAEIARDESVSDDDWERILTCLASGKIKLGRAKATGYGGEYSCALIDLKEAEMSDCTVNPGGLVSVLVLSDLALFDEWGAPTCHPERAMLGLPEGAEFQPRQSVLSLRRHAPWNGKLRARDTERQFIEAGSMLCFELSEGGIVSTGRKRAGLWQEAGFGEIWVQPEFLLKETLPVSAEFGLVSQQAGATDRMADTDIERIDADTAFSAWLAGRRQTVRPANTGGGMRHERERASSAPDHRGHVADLHWLR